MSHWQFSSSVMKSELSPKAKLTLLAMDMHVNAMGASCWPSHKTLAALTSMGISTVKEAIAIAEAGGWLVKVERFDAKGRNITNEYFLRVPSAPAIASESSLLVDNLGAEIRPLGLGSQNPAPYQPESGPPKGSQNPATELPIELTKKEKKRASPIPANFSVTAEMKEWATSKSYADPEKLVEAFCDHHAAKGSKFICWQAAFRTWIRNDAKFGVSTNTTRQVSKPVQSRHDLSKMNYAGSDDQLPF